MPRELGAIEVEVVGHEVCVNFQAPASAGDQHVQASLTALLIERAEVHRHMSARHLAVADADEHDVPFVALDVLQVLDEEGFLRVTREERLGGLVGTASELHLVFDPARLGKAEGGDAKCQIRPPLGVFHDRVGDDACLAGVETLADASFVARSRFMMEAEAGFLTLRVRTREEHEPVVIELMVRDGNQRFVAAAVVPAQHPFGSAGRAEHAKNALEIGGRRGFLRDGVPVGHAVEEACRRELLAVSHDDGLPGAQDGPQCVYGPDLAGFVEDDEIEADRTGRNELGD